MSAPGGAKAWHGDAHDALAVELELVESLYADKERESGVESAADAQHHRLGMSVQYAFGETHHLDVENLVARLLHVAIGRYERVRVHISLEREIVGHGGGLGTAYVYLLAYHAALGVYEGGVAPPVGVELFHVDLREDELAVHGETLAFGKQLAVLIYQGVATVDHVLRALAKARATVHVTANGARALLAEQALQVIVLAYELIARREVEDDFGARQGKVVARRRGSPHVLANLHAEQHAVASTEQLRGRGDKHWVTGIAYLLGAQVLRRGEPPLLVELAVIGKEGLGHYAKNLATLDDDGAVEQQVARDQWHADDGDDVKLPAELQQLHHAVLRSVQE